MKNNDFDFDLAAILAKCDPFKKPFNPTPDEEAAWAAESAKRVERDARLAAKLAAEAKADDLEESRIPARYRWALEHPNAATTLGCDASLTASLGKVASDRCATFRGPTGAGKTTLACLALWRAKLANDSLRIMFVTATELEHERRITRLGTDSAELERRATHADIVLIDEIGQEVGAFSPLIDIVFARYDAMRPTWITTGVSAAVLTEKYGAGFVRRLFEGAQVFSLGKREAK